MHSPRFPVRVSRCRWLGVPLALLTLVFTVRSQEITQTVSLQPGWNSVWLEVDPQDRTPSAVFAGVPVTSVWTFSERVSATDFIQNPESTGWNRAQWLAYFPTNSPEARLANLFAILPQRAYLVRLAGSNAVEWAVTGRPTLNTPPWVPDRFNLRGFPVDPDQAPTFGQFFRSSPAHFEPAAGRLESIFHLHSDGQWKAVSAQDPMRRHEAYWVFTRGTSEFVAPFSVSLNSGESVNFDTVKREVTLTLRNRHGLDKSIRIAPAGPHTSPLLLLPPISAGPNHPPQPLSTHDQRVTAQGGTQLRLALDRAQLPGSPATDAATGRHQNLLSVADGEGTLFYVGVVAQVGDPLDFTGLWMGTVTITNVSPALGGTNGPSSPGPVAVGFPLRLLLHVDTGGQVTLLRDVTLVYTRTNLPSASGSGSGSGTGNLTQLVTDPARLARYTASDIQSGQVSGRRITAPHFDFARTNGQFGLPLQGVFASSNSVTGTLTIPASLPTNPFLHRYHPDHSTNAYAVTRDIHLNLLPDPDGNSTGEESIGGTYWETIVGLHRQPLYASGSLALTRISNLGALNTENP